MSDIGEWEVIEYGFPKGRYIYILNSQDDEMGTGMFRKGKWVFKDDYKSPGDPDHWMPIHTSKK